MITGLGYALIERGTVRGRLVGGVARTLYRAGLAGCDAVIFHNRDDRDVFERLRLLPPRARRVVVNGSGVDLERFAVAPFPDGPPVCLYLGRLSRRKGIHEFVDAARLVRRSRPDVRFRVLGWPEAGPGGVGAAAARAWEREGAIEYLGVADDVRPHLAAATVLALPSYSEGTPRSVLEAMATGRPVVTTDAPGCRDAVTDGDNGLLVPVGDAAALAAALLRVLADPDLARRLGRRGRAIAEERYDVRRVNAVMLAELGLAPGVYSSQ
jgi:glycosyltransferase involved in cell wall biosynthesis